MDYGLLSFPKLTFKALLAMIGIRDTYGKNHFCMQQSASRILSTECMFSHAFQKSTLLAEVSVEYGQVESLRLDTSQNFVFGFHLESSPKDTTCRKKRHEL